MLLIFLVFQVIYMCNMADFCRWCNIHMQLLSLFDYKQLKKFFFVNSWWIQDILGTGHYLCSGYFRLAIGGRGG